MKTIIIAEAGVNHNGDILLAKRLVDAAAEAGADYVKFQTFKADKLVSKQSKKAAYQIENTNDDSESQLEMLKKLELSEAEHELLISYCEQKGIKFFSTAFDLDSLQYLANIGLSLVKVPSGEITNLPYLKKAAALFKKVIISTGMSTALEIDAALKVFTGAGLQLNDITVLHCNTEYPSPMEDVNLNAMNSIKNIFNVDIGYSDHTQGIEVPIAAVALGATIIEKHFTLDRTLPGPDHPASLEPEELASMIKAIRNIEMALGSSIKEPTPSEIKNIAIARKSIHLNVDLKKGDIIKETDLIMLRPGDGLSPMKMEEITGKKVNKDLSAGSKLLQEDLSV